MFLFNPAGSVSELKLLGIQCEDRPAFFAGRSLFDSLVKGYFVLAYTNQYPCPASSTSRRSLSLIYRDRLAISYHDHAHSSGDPAAGSAE